MRTIIISSLLIAMLAGCTDNGGNEEQDVIIEDEGELASGKGAINGLLIDDAFRPIPTGTVFLFPLGLEKVTTINGEFQFADLDPGDYELRVVAEGHEASQTPVRVVEGEFTDVNVEARRVYNEGGTIITTEYSVFVPCAVSAPAISVTTDCTGDGSGDTYRPGFDSDFTSIGNITYLITEMKASVEASSTNGALKVVIREQGDGQYYASGFTTDGDYLRFVNPINATSTYDTEGRNVNWTNDRGIETLLFPQGAFKDESQGAQDTTCSTAGQGCFESRGIGAQFGVKGQFIQTLFIGEPEVDVETYCVLCSS